MTLRKWIEGTKDDTYVRCAKSAPIPIDEVPDRWYDYNVESVDRYIKEDGQTFKEVISIWKPR